MTWGVILVPVEDNPLSGLAVVLTDGDERSEVSRVGYQRKDTNNPGADLAQQLEAEIEKADAAAEIVNDFQAECDRLQAEAAERARERLRAILGEPSKELQ